MSAGDRRVFLELPVRRVDCPVCKVAKTERQPLLADNPFFTRRAAYYIGRRCRDSTVKAIAEELHLEWRTVKEFDKEYMRKQLDAAGVARPKVLGIDEIHLGKKLGYRIVVTDLLRGRAIWFGGTDRKMESLQLFYDWLGPSRSRAVRLVVMDMWKPYELCTRQNVPTANILFDKFHVLKGLGEALDDVRKSEYGRLTGAPRKFIKGQKYALLSNPDSLTTAGRAGLRKLLAANKRLNTAYLLKESFAQLWGYTKPAWALKFFENWKASLKWQRLGPYQKFVGTVERHWEGIIVYCDPANHVPLGFVEGFNNKIRSMQRRAFGFHDEEYLRLKLLTCMLKPS